MMTFRFDNSITSLGSNWACLILVLTCFKAVCNLVASPPISTVIPLILFMSIHLLNFRHEKSTYINFIVSAKYILIT